MVSFNESFSFFGIHGLYLTVSCSYFMSIPTYQGLKVGFYFITILFPFIVIYHYQSNPFFFTEVEFHKRLFGIVMPIPPVILNSYLKSWKIYIHFIRVNKMFIIFNYFPLIYILYIFKQLLFLMGYPISQWVTIRTTHLSFLSKTETRLKLFSTSVTYKSILLS